MINIALSERKQGIKNCVQRDQRQNKDLNRWVFFQIFNNFSLARRSGQLGATAGSCKNNAFSRPAPSFILIAKTGINHFPFDL